MPDAPSGSLSRTSSGWSGPRSRRCTRAGGRSSRASRRPPGSPGSSPAAAPLAGVLATAATAAFFRAPRRVPPPLTGVVLAAADGTVATVGEVAPPPSWVCPRYLCLGSASSCPCWTCTCSACRSRGGSWPSEYRPGQFLSADLDKASEDNERNARADRDRRGAAGRRRADRGAVGPADRLRHRRRRRGGGGRDLRVDPLRVAGGRVPAGGLAGRRRARAADDRRRDRARELPGPRRQPPGPG